MARTLARLPSQAEYYRYERLPSRLPPRREGQGTLPVGCGGGGDDELGESSDGGCGLHRAATL